MEDLPRELMSQLESKTSFVIPIGNGIPVPDSAVVTWIIMALLVGLAILFTRRMELVPKGKQTYVEALVGLLNGFLGSILGKHASDYTPFLGTIALYLGCANLIGIFGLTPPTKDLNVTAGLAIMSILLIEGAGLRKRGMRGWLHHFNEPMPLIMPLNVLELVIRPMSLCMRLFGNVLGAFVVMELIKMLAPIAVPIPFSLYFDVFDGLIQTIVFVFLTTLFLKESIE